MLACSSGTATGDSPTADLEHTAGSAIYIMYIKKSFSTKVEIFFLPI